MMTAFNRKSSFATVVRFFNMIDTCRPSKELRTNYIEEFYTVAKLLFLLNAAKETDRDRLRHGM